jgi:hypothetical protein
MTLYRYNAKNRTDRKFNNCENEKNPLGVKFYATSLEYANCYKTAVDANGCHYTCELEVTELGEENLFDIESGFAGLSTYATYVKNYIETRHKDFNWHIKMSKSKNDIKLFEGFVANLYNGTEEKEIQKQLHENQFQQLSDFCTQLLLVQELREMGYTGYFTSKEVAIF